jgi:hypothetical protein
MAAWQADFELLPDDIPLPTGYRARLDGLLPRGRSWAPDLERWGDETGHRIDVWRAGDGSASALLRVDMRHCDPAWIERVFLVVRSLGRQLGPVWSEGSHAPSDPGELALVLEGSPAFRFVADPQAFIRRLRVGRDEDT